MMKSRLAAQTIKYLVLTVISVLLLSVGSADARDRKTKTLVLDNGLSVYLMSDPEVTRSAAALSVGVGHIYDPKEKQGLAHYLEHMLFLGTEKYPDVEDYKKYLNSNSGASNAYTADDVTNYFFQVSHDAFEGALDRFSQFFKAPLFSPKYAEREVNAVNSEFDKNKLQDGWRSNHLVQQVSEPGHPMQKFGIGSKETLAGDNRPALLDFYKKYYSASIMKLAILSNLPLGEQEKVARAMFGDIPNRPVKLPFIDPEFRKPLNGKYRLLKVKTIKDTRTLSLEFPTIRLYDYQDSKPASIVGSVVGYEGKGSLLSKLKDEGLALGLSAGGGYSHPNISTFGININLTRKGEAEYKKVLAIVFSYIQFLKKDGIQSYTFKQNQRMAEINHEWRELDEGMGYVAGQASLMQRFPLDKIETLPYLIMQENTSAYREIIDTLTPENALVVLSSQNVSTDKKEHFFGTEYALVEVGGDDFKALKNPPVVAGLSYPEKNPFIPNGLALFEENPHVIRDDALAKVYFQFDHRFEKPKVYLKFLIETPHVYDNPHNLARSKLYQAAIMEGLNELTYPIAEAGLSYALSLEKEGVVFVVGGYSERIQDLLKLVVRNLKTITINEQKFHDLKDEFIRGVENQKLGQGYARAGYFNRQIWMVHQFTEEQLLEGLKTATFDEIREYAHTLFERVYVTAVIYGNWSEQKAGEAVDLVVQELGSQPLPQEERFDNKVVVLNDSENLQYSERVEDNNNALFYTLQAGPHDFKRYGVYQLVASIIESDFYTQMRTNQQLGYVVWSFGQRLEDRLFLKLIIQSAGYGPFELKKRVEAWMDAAPGLFDKLTDEEFEKHRDSLVVSLEKKPDSIAEKTAELYYLATDEKGDFDYKEKLIEAVKTVTREEVVVAARELFSDGKTSRSIVLVRSRSNEDKVPDGVIEDIEKIKELNRRRNTSS